MLKGNHHTAFLALITLFFVPLTGLGLWQPSERNSKLNFNEIPIPKHVKDGAKSNWDASLGSVKGIGGEFGKNVAGQFEGMAENLGLKFSESPSPSSTITPTPSITPTVSPTPSSSMSSTPTATPSKSVSMSTSPTPTKSPSPTPTKQTPSPSSSYSPDVEFISTTTDIIEVPSDGSEAETEIEMTQDPDHETIEPASEGEEVLVEDFSVDGDLGDIPVSTRQLFTQSLLRRSTARQTLTARYIYLKINGQLITMKVKVNCKGSLQPLENPIQIITKLEKLTKGGLGLNAKYKVTDASGMSCKVVFRFRIRRKIRQKWLATPSSTIIPLPTFSDLPQFLSPTPSSASEVSTIPTPSVSYSPAISATLTPSTSPTSQESMTASPSYSASPDSSSQIASPTASETSSLIASPSSSKSYSPIASPSASETSSPTASPSFSESSSQVPSPSATASASSACLSDCRCEEPGNNLGDASFDGSEFETFGTASSVWRKSNFDLPDDFFRSDPRSENVEYSSGELTMKITQQNTDYFGAGIRTQSNWYGYGCVSACMKPSGVSGIISSLFTYTSEWDGIGSSKPNHNEIDIEFEGQDTTKVQFNYCKLSSLVFYTVL